MKPINLVCIDKQAPVARGHRVYHVSLKCFDYDSLY